MQALREDLPKSRRKANVEAVQLEPGKRLEKVPGGFVIIGGQNASGKWSVELQQDERLHEATRIMKVCPVCKKIYSEEDFKQVKKCSKCDTPATNFEDKVFLAGYIIQPAGAPTLSAKGVSGMTHLSVTWLHKITRRGPLDALGGLQGYIMNEAGNDWVPKFGTGVNGSEVMYYKSDVKAWMEKYAPPVDQEEWKKKQEEELEKYRQMAVPEGMYNLFKSLGEEEKQSKGYVTRTKILNKAKELTNKMDPEELHNKYRLDKPVQDRDYPLIIATAIQEEWKDNPRKARNTAAYRRKPRAF